MRKEEEAANKLCVGVRVHGQGKKNSTASLFLHEKYIQSQKNSTNNIFSQENACKRGQKVIPILCFCTKINEKRGK
jgi:ribose 5-phosphate isomerase RpiB